MNKNNNKQQKQPPRWIKPTKVFAFWQGFSSVAFFTLYTLLFPCTDTFFFFLFLCLICPNTGSGTLLERRSRWAKKLQRLRRDFAKSFPGLSTWLVWLRRVAWRSGRSWLHGVSDRLVSLWRRGPAVGHCFRRDSTDVRKVGENRASLTENETEVST